MKILNILQCANLGGMEQSSLRLMNALSPMADFEVVSVHPFGPLEPMLKEAGIPALDCSYRGPMGLGSHLELRRMLRKVGLDRPIMMTGPTITGLLALPVKRRHPRVLMVHFHHEGVHSNWTWKQLYRLALERFDHITYPSDFVCEEAIALCPELASRSLTLRNVVEMPVMVSSQERGAVRKFLGLPENAIVIGNAGWLIPRKRFDVFLEVAAQVKSQTAQPVFFLIAGDGHLREELENQAQHLGIIDYVRFVGWVKDMRIFYASIDLLLFNTDWDAYPTTPIEAMSHGIPVVASALKSGIGEVIVPGTGVLHGEHDAKALGTAVVQLLEDPLARREMGIRARARVEEMSAPEMTWLPVAKLFGLAS